MKIGFFDSGLGGILILNAVRELLPQYDYVFFGDTAHLPYGDKTQEEIFYLTKNGLELLFAAGCAVVVVACNTASAETLRHLQDEWLAYEYPDRKLLGVIVPMVEEVIECHAKRVVLIGTTRTVASRKYEQLFARHDRSPQLFSIATPALVPFIESGKIDEAMAIVTEIIEEGKRAGMDSLILGCTHYALLLPYINELYGNSLMIFSPCQIIPKKVFRYLHRHDEVIEQLTTGGTVDIRLSKPRPDYRAFIERHV
jgi:glutamate racemase